MLTILLKVKIFYLFRVLRKDLVGILRWHYPRTFQHMKLWEKMLNRHGSFKMTMSTKICSNHFAAGYCSDVSPIPTLYLKGYGVKESSKRKDPNDRSNFLKHVPKKKVVRDGFEIFEEDENTISTPFIGDHCYENIIPTSNCAFS